MPFLRRPRTARCDALDIAALWPCLAQTAGVCVPEMDAVRTGPETDKEEVRHGIR